MNPNEAAMRRYSATYKLSLDISKSASALRFLSWILSFFGLGYALFNLGNSDKLRQGVTTFLAGSLAYILSEVAAGVGRILETTTDQAVNGSPFLSDDERAKVMSL